MRHLERAVMLQQLDMHWREHLAGMDYLRQGIYLRAYAQKNPKQEYKREAFELFTAMLDRIRSDTVMLLQRLQVRTEEEIEREEAERQRRLQSPDAAAARGAAGARRRAAEPPAAEPATRRPCGAGGRPRCHSCAASVRSAATNPAPADRAASSSTVTERCSGPAAERRSDQERTDQGWQVHRKFMSLPARLSDAEGRVLIAQRPRGRHMAGRWEFPGGKLDLGEDPYDGLKRELAEELGVGRARARPLIRLRHDYPDRRVLLDVWQVTAYDGEPKSLDSQALAWARPDELPAHDLLEADRAIVTALRLPAARARDRRCRRACRAGERGADDPLAAAGASPRNSTRRPCARARAAGHRVFAMGSGVDASADRGDRRLRRCRAALARAEPARGPRRRVPGRRALRGRQAAALEAIGEGAHFLVMAPKRGPMLHRDLEPLCANCRRPGVRRLVPGCAPPRAAAGGRSARLRGCAVGTYPSKGTSLVLARGRRSRGSSSSRGCRYRGSERADACCLDRARPRMVGRWRPASWISSVVLREQHVVIGHAVHHQQPIAQLAGVGQHVRLPVTLRIFLRRAEVALRVVRVVEAPVGHRRTGDAGGETCRVTASAASASCSRRSSSRRRRRAPGSTNGCCFSQSTPRSWSTTSTPPRCR